MNHEFAKMITMLRHERGLSQKRAADDLGISQALLSHYENGVREPKLDFLIRAGEYYDVTTDFLLGISPHRQPSRFPEIQKNEGELLCYNNAVVIHSALEEIGDERLSQVVWEYVGFTLYIILTHLRRPEDTLGPMFEAAKMRTVYMLLSRMRELSKTPGAIPELTDQALRHWYPEEFESVRMLEDLINERIESIKNAAFSQS